MKLFYGNFAASREDERKKKSLGCHRQNSDYLCIPTSSLPHHLSCRSFRILPVPSHLDEKISLNSRLPFEFECCFTTSELARPILTRARPLSSPGCFVKDSGGVPPSSGHPLLSRRRPHASLLSRRSPARKGSPSYLLSAMPSIFPASCRKVRRPMLLSLAMPLSRRRRFPSSWPSKTLSRREFTPT